MDVYEYIDEILLTAERDPDLLYANISQHPSIKIVFSGYVESDDGEDIEIYNLYIHKKSIDDDFVFGEEIKLISPDVIEISAIFLPDDEKWEINAIYFTDDFSEENLIPIVEKICKNNNK